MLSGVFLLIAVLGGSTEGLPTDPNSLAAPSDPTSLGSAPATDADTCENDLWDNCSSVKCCPGQSMCFRMSEWYSQCSIYSLDGWLSGTIDCTFDDLGTFDSLGIWDEDLGEINSCAWRDWSMLALAENIYLPERVVGPDERANVIGPLFEIQLVGGCDPGRGFLCEGLKGRPNYAMGVSAGVAPGKTVELNTEGRADLLVKKVQQCFSFIYKMQGADPGLLELFDARDRTTPIWSAKDATDADGKQLWQKAEVFIAPTSEGTELGFVATIGMQYDSIMLDEFQLRDCPGMEWFDRENEGGEDPVEALGASPTAEEILASNIPLPDWDNVEDTYIWTNRVYGDRKAAGRRRSAVSEQVLVIPESCELGDAYNYATRTCGDSRAIELPRTEKADKANCSDVKESCIWSIWSSENESEKYTIVDSKSTKQFLGAAMQAEGLAWGGKLSGSASFAMNEFTHSNSVNFVIHHTTDGNAEELYNEEKLELDPNAADHLLFYGAESFIEQYSAHFVQKVIKSSLFNGMVTIKQSDTMDATQINAYASYDAGALFKGEVSAEFSTENNENHLEMHSKIKCRGPARVCSGIDYPDEEERRREGEEEEGEEEEEEEGSDTQDAIDDSHVDDSSAVSASEFHDRMIKLTGDMETAYAGWVMALPTGPDDGNLDDYYSNSRMVVKPWYEISAVTAASSQRALHLAESVDGYESMNWKDQQEERLKFYTPEIKRLKLEIPNAASIQTIAEESVLTQIDINNVKEILGWNCIASSGLAAEIRKVKLDIQAHFAEIDSLTLTDLIVLEEAFINGTFEWFTGQSGYYVEYLNNMLASVVEGHQTCQNLYQIPMTKVSDLIPLAETVPAVVDSSLTTGNYPDAADNLQTIQAPIAFQDQEQNGLLTGLKFTVNQDNSFYGFEGFGQDVGLTLITEEETGDDVLTDLFKFTDNPGADLTLQCPDHYYVRGIKMTFGKVTCSCDDPEPDFSRSTLYLGYYSTYSCSDGAQGYCPTLHRCTRQESWERDGDKVPSGTCVYDTAAAEKVGFRRAEVPEFASSAKKTTLLRRRLQGLSGSVELGAVETVQLVCSMLPEGNYGIPFQQSKEQGQTLVNVAESTDKQAMCSEGWMVSSLKFNIQTFEFANKWIDANGEPENKETDCEWVGGKGVQYLDRYHPTCSNNQVMGRWQMKKDDCGSGDWKINYRCQEIADADGITSWHTKCQEVFEGRLQYLDRHDIYCPNGQFLNSWHFAKGDCGDSYWQFQFTCIRRKSGDTINHKDAVTRYTGCHEVEYEKNDSPTTEQLDDHNLNCPDGYGLTAFRMQPNDDDCSGDERRFRYKCAPMFTMETPEPNPITVGPFIASVETECRDVGDFLIEKPDCKHESWVNAIETGADLSGCTASFDEVKSGLLGEEHKVCGLCDACPGQECPV